MAPGKQGSESLIEIVTVRQLSQFQNYPIFLDDCFLQVLFTEDKTAAFQEMQILDQVKHTLAGAAKPGDILVPVCVNITVAEFVVQIPQAQFDIIDLIFPRRRRKIIRQNAEQIFRRTDTAAAWSVSVLRASPSFRLPG